MTFPEEELPDVAEAVHAVVREAEDCRLLSHETTRPATPLISATAATLAPGMTISFCDDLGPHGFSWIVAERMTRTSHALCADGRVWLVDPVDWPEAIDRAWSLGQPTAVVQLLDRHNRDCAAIAARLGVPHLVVPASLPETPFEVIQVVRWRRWRETALWWPERRTLVVAEALGTNAFFTVGDDRVGVHGLLKPLPPRLLRDYEPEHLLVGHGEGIHGPGASAALHQALARSRLSFFRWGVTLPFRARKMTASGRAGAA